MARVGSSTGAASGRPSDRKGGASIDMGILPDLIGFNLRCAQVAWFSDFSKSVGSHEISAPQFGTLLLIEANPGISQSAVAEALRFDRSTLVQIIDRLEGRELVVREVSANDRRSHALRVTEAGVEMLRILKAAAEKHEEEISRALTEDERKEVIRLLIKLHSPEA